VEDEGEHKMDNVGLVILTATAISLGVLATLFHVVMEIIIRKELKKDADIQGNTGDSAGSG
jgi:hypothetical protein